VVVHRRDRDAAAGRFGKDGGFVVAVGEPDSGVQPGGDALHLGLGEYLGEGGDERVAPRLVVAFGSAPCSSSSRATSSVEWPGSVLSIRE
jgi:hypothetical protein